MITPFDKAIEAIAKARYHNHRLEDHSDTVSVALFNDLQSMCTPLLDDLNKGIVKVWLNVSSPGDRARKVDLFVGEPDENGGPDINRIRIALENKSVIAAHRNRTSRFDDLRKVLSAIHGTKPEAILVATVLVGLARRVLNVPDRIKSMYKRDQEDRFAQEVLPRLSSGDQNLWEEFHWAVSSNSSSDPLRTLELLRTLPTRKPGHTAVEGFDYVLQIPVLIDNVNPPMVARSNDLGIDVDTEYQSMLEQMCSAYVARWHM